MSISHLNNNIPSHDLLSSDSTSLSKGQGANQEDVQWFSAALDMKHTSLPTHNVAESVVSSLSSENKQLKDLSDKADKALEKASMSTNPENMIKANQSLSSFYLDTLLTTKLISKGTQAVEKLTSLQ